VIKMNKLDLKLQIGDWATIDIHTPYQRAGFRS